MSTIIILGSEIPLSIFINKYSELKSSVLCNNSTCLRSYLWMRVCTYVSVAYMDYRRYFYFLFCCSKYFVVTVIVNILLIVIQIHGRRSNVDYNDDNYYSHKYLKYYLFVKLILLCYIFINNKRKYAGLFIAESRTYRTHSNSVYNFIIFI